MLTPDRLLRLTIEFIFILLGALILWLAFTRPVLLDRRSTGWMVLSIALVLWGLRALYKPGQWWARWEIWTRGLSLVLLGVVMFVISRVPFEWVGRLFALCGVLLILRGLVASALIFRPR
jgi:hypothetical protein